MHFLWTVFQKKNYSYMISSSLLVLYFLPLLIGKLKKGSSIRLDFAFEKLFAFCGIFKK